MSFEHPTPETEVPIVAVHAAHLNPWLLIWSRPRQTIQHIVLSCIMLGAIGGVFGLYIMGALVRWTGKWLGGRGSPEHIRAALAWSEVPYVCILALFVVQTAFLREEMFTSATPRLDGSYLLLAVLIVGALAAIAIWIWRFYILMNALGQVQGFSAWLATGNWLLAYAVLLAPIFLLVILMSG